MNYPIEGIERQRQAPNGLWRTLRYNFERARDVARFVARERYAFPGGYEMFAITDDGGALCNDCCAKEYATIARSVAGDGWHTVAVDSTANCDMESLSCDHCGREIYAPETD